MNLAKSKGGNASVVDSIRNTNSLDPIDDPKGSRWTRDSIIGAVSLALGAVSLVLGILEIRYRTLSTLSLVVWRVVSYCIWGNPESKGKTSEGESAPQTESWQLLMGPMLTNSESR